MKSMANGWELSSAEGVSGVVRASEIQARQVCWLWPQRIPLGSMTVLAGPPGSAKSKLTYDLAARVSRGLAMPLGSTSSKKGGVLLLEAEDDYAQATRPTLEAMGADLEAIVLPQCPSGIRIPRDIALLDEWISVVDAKLVVVNPLSSFLETPLTQNVNARRVLEPLNMLAKDRNLAVLLVQHPPKGRQRSVLDYAAGSRAVVEMARTFLVVTPDPDYVEEHRFVLALGKSNLGTAKAVSFRTIPHNNETIVIDWLGEKQVSPNELLEGGGSREAASQLEIALDLIYSLLQFGPKPQREIMAAAKKNCVSEKTVRRAAERIGVNSRRIGASHWAWELPGGRSPQMDHLRERYLDGVMDYLFDNK